MYERPYLSPRPPPKISLRHDHNWTRGNDQLGSTVEQQPVGKLVQQSWVCTANCRQLQLMTSPVREKSLPDEIPEEAAANDNSNDSNMSIDSKPVETDGRRGRYLEINHLRLRCGRTSCEPRRMAKCGSETFKGLSERTTIRGPWR